MVWAKFSDEFPDHPKVAPLSSDAFRLHVSGVCYSCRYLTDGFVPEGESKRIRGYKPRVLKELTDGRLWRPVDGGFQIVSFLEYNPSKEKVEEERAKATKRKADWNAKKNGGKNAVPNGVGNASPTRPDPARPEGSRAGVSEEPVLPPDEEPDTSLDPEQVELNVTQITSIRGRLREGPKAS